MADLVAFWGGTMMGDGWEGYYRVDEVGEESKALKWVQEERKGREERKGGERRSKRGR